MGKLINKLICDAKSAWYNLAEPTKLKYARLNWRSEKNPLISVYVPTYNRPELLIKRAVKSILKQSYKNFQLIVVDDGSDLDKIPHFDYDSRISYYYLPPRKHLKDKKKDWLLGPTRAANFALKACRGSWIARNDDDDIWTKTHLEKLLRFAQRGNYEMVYGSTLQKRGGKYARFHWQNTDVPLGSIQASLYRSYLKCFKFNKHCWRKTWNANNDLDMPLRMAKVGVRIGHLDTVVTLILPRPGCTKLGSKAL